MAWCTTGGGLGISSDTTVGGLGRSVAIAAAFSHNLALGVDGRVSAWGTNSAGQLGDGTTQSRSNTSGVLVADLTQVVAIQAGTAYSMGLKADGTVWVWGRGNYGQWGNGTTGAIQTRPVQVPALSGVIAIAAGHYHCLALRHDGTIWGWGRNPLGDGAQHLVPVQVATAGCFVGIAAGNGFNLALNADGTVWAWGNNSDGQLGDGTTLPRQAPVRVVGPVDVVAFAAGGSHSLARASDGRLWAWGSNACGQLGNGDIVRHRVPVQIQGLSDITALTAQGEHNLALAKDGRVWAWGSNATGELGDNTFTDRAEPILVEGLGNVVKVAAGWGFSLALGKDGSLWGWGTSSSGELGGDAKTYGRPVQIPGLPPLTSMAAGSSHTVALTNQGQVWTWGANTYGQLGDGTTTGPKAPLQVNGLGDVVEVAAGYSASYALTSDGRLWAWGDNHNGQMGNGGNTPNAIPVPTLVPGLPSVKRVWAAAWNVIVQAQDGSILGWGFNGVRELLSGASTYLNTPTQMPELAGMGDLAIGNQFLLVLKGDGTVWGRGDCMHGQLGQTGPTAHSMDALQDNLALKDVVATAAGYRHGLALNRDGHVWAWGADTSGQIGQKRQLFFSTPVLLPFKP